MTRIAANAAPGLATIVGKVGAGIAVAECAARSAGDGAGPRSRGVIICTRDYAVRIIWIDRDGCFVLWRTSGVLIDGHVGSRDRRSIERAGQNKRRRYRTGRTGNRKTLLRLLFNESGKADLQAWRSIHGCDLSGERVDVVLGLPESCLRQA